MALTTITNSMVSVNAIQGTLIADNAITAVHIATNAVSGTLIADNAITATHIAQNIITVTQLADDAVEGAKIADGIITTNHLNKAMISSQTEVSAVAGDYVLLGDTSDSNNLKKAPISSILAGTLTTAAQTNITSVGTLTTLTVDDITINGSTISDGGDLTLDVGGDLTIDVDGGDISFVDGGTEYGRFSNSSGDLWIATVASDKDIIFRGNDGSSYITALTLDMSDAGTATFNHDVNITGTTIASENIRIRGGASTPISGEARLGGHVQWGAQIYGYGSTNDISLVNRAGTTAMAVLANSTNITMAGTLGVTGIISPTTHIDMPDNARIRLGAQPDLQIFHNGTDSYVQDTGTGSLMLAGSAVFITNADASETLIRGVADGAVTLYHNNVAKLDTVSGGVTVTGTLIADNITMTDNEYIRLGDSNDLLIYHDSNNSYIEDDGTGDLRLKGGTVRLQGTGGTNLLVGITGGATSLYHNNAAKLATASGGIDVTGAVNSTGTITSTASTALTLDLAGTHANGNYLRMSKGGAVQFYIGASDSVGGGSGFYDHYAIASIGQRFWTGAGERMRITSDGDVGIGCTPGSGTRLEIRDTANAAIMELSGTDGRGLKLFTRKSDYPTNSGQNDAAVVYDAQDTEASSVYGQHIFQTGGTTRMQIDKAGVGIGTASPAGALDLVSQGYGTWPFYVRRSANGAQLAGIYESSEGDGGHGMLYLMDGGGTTDVKLSTNGVSWFNGGNVGIGLTTPGHKLCVNGTSEFYNTMHVHSSSYLQWTGGVYWSLQSTNSSNDFRFTTAPSGGSEHFRIASNGTLTATDTSIGSNSDSRLKENIENYSYDINKFKSYEPRIFDWKNPEQHGNISQQIGFIAQEQEIIDNKFIDNIKLDAEDTVEDNPDIALIDADRLIKTSKFGQKDAMYVSVIQQLITRLETAEAKIAVLEG